MNKHALRISVGGQQRLREAVEAQMRQVHQDELSKATDESQKAKIEEMIQQKIRGEMERVTSFPLGFSLTESPEPSALGKPPWRTEGLGFGPWTFGLRPTPLDIPQL